MDKTHSRHRRNTPKEKGHKKKEMGARKINTIRNRKLKQANKAAKGGVGVFVGGSLLLQTWEFPPKIPNTENLVFPRPSLKPKQNIHDWYFTAHNAAMTIYFFISLSFNPNTFGVTLLTASTPFSSQAPSPACPPGWARGRPTPSSSSSASYPTSRPTAQRKPSASTTATPPLLLSEGGRAGGGRGAGPVRL